MRFIKWSLGIITLIVVLGAAAVTFLLEPAVQRLRPVLTSKLSELSGVKVDFEEISARILPTPRLELKNVSAAGGISASRLYIASRITEMMSGEIVIDDILFESPKVDIKRLEDGSFSIGTLQFGKKSPKSSKNNSDQDNSEAAKKTSPQPTEHRAITITKLAIRDGEINFYDAKSETETPIKKLDLTLKDFNLDKNSEFEAALSIFKGEISASGNLVPKSFMEGKPSGRITIKGKKFDFSQAEPLVKSLTEKSGTIQLSGSATADINLDLNQGTTKADLKFDGKELGIKFAPASGTTMINHVSGSALTLSAEVTTRPDKNVDIQTFNLAMGSSKISGSARIAPDSPESLKLHLKDLRLEDLKEVIILPIMATGNASGDLAFNLRIKPIPDIKGEILLNDVAISSVKPLSGKVNFEGKQITAALFGGTIKIKHQLSENTPKIISGTIDATDLDLRQLSDLYPSSFGITGKLSSLHSNLSGDSSDLKKTLNANFKATAEKGEILGVNLLGEVFEKIGVIPGLTESLASMLPEQLRPLASKGNSTAYESLILEGSVSNGTRISFTRAELAHSAYIFSGSGTVTTAGEIDLKTQLKLTPQVTKQMVTRNDKFKLLLDRGEVLTLPVVIKKGDGSLLVLPDVSELGKNLLQGGAKDAATKALDKLKPGLGTGAKELLNKLF